MRLPADDGPPLLAVDVDGTLLDPHKRVTAATAAAIAAVRGAGVTLVLATGRLPTGIATVCRELGLSGPQVCAHGAVVRDPLTGEVFESHPLNRADVEAHLRFAAEAGVEAIVADADGFRMAVHRPDLEHLFVPYHEPLPQVVDTHGLSSGTPLKTYLDTGRERYREVLAAAHARFGHGYTVTSPDDRSVELLAPGVTKLTGLRAAARALGIAADDFMAVGDGLNDVPLLEAARISVAMGQAPPEVKAAAQQVTRTNDADGLAQAITQIYAGRLRARKASTAAS